jgi:hypothetical protein
VIGLKPLSSFVVLLLANLLGRQSGFQVLNILLIAGVFARFW